MIVIPAIDLLDGRVVRLAQGRRDEVTVYSKDPVTVAKRWVADGASWLHVVDLNGAFDGTYTNLPIAERIIEACGIRVELSGGIRTKETLTGALRIGAARVILGTKACEDPAFVQEAADRYGHKIAVAIDAKAGQVVSRGWVSSTPLTPAGLARSVVMLGVETIVCTDVSRDGMLQGPNLSLLSDVLAAAPRQLIASGGISSLADLQQLRSLEPRGLIGAIIGKALYEGTINLREAITLVASDE
ncbi:MAG: 1-(5-phosphoribosyl)-5-[(5-phosphoribosylamino)methylideneamino]imidazole-4-carboxamide isomerase [Candidatus Omnitrophica bacterium]|nr:1-(5-phosphoribosyl)-5-[(5-phosphoribosylamino)methylideneamino]imidazole-4-carboxamide isomerase [Candidatus Omnitrophota bacterium]MBI3083761.1 1-(5-phosphoribosyl)-5-[(5-phosphoribosylamino)methylideneamino]imidazole-4-carboxamide isomerase [Candidatus Omnitrophota bacterium]